GTYLFTPLAQLLALRFGAIAIPRDRDIHATATPRWGGLAIWVGVALALAVARQMPALSSTFVSGSETTGVLIAGGLICLLGAIDDRFELDALTKLTGQVFCAGAMVILGGVQLVQVYIPFGDVGTLSLGRDLGVPITIFITVVTINALNFIDGLDGLAAGVTAIAALAFFAHSYHLAMTGSTDVAAAPTVITALLAGACVGFLPHNFHPARIFMGDSGSMLLGLMLAAAATTASSGTDPQAAGRLMGSLPLALPLLIPALVLAVPFLDFLLAVARRVRRRQSPMHPDKKHLHHRLLEIGHSHCRAVLLMYFWTALLAFGGVSFTITHSPWAVIVALGGLGVFGIALSAPGLRWPARRSAQ
ncbi:MAG: undecaprenyl/decaprenyl-phosphate alpha-N-acetylglucosaminyl 1-phosphate transferase, partial [Frankiaceae bacterium]|nr:undecaprenyl/decaprenyl-phosphate alpha-N-acetylglucosaminyl 1-phosphate transferase [Frankiaceae bacterium]